MNKWLVVVASGATIAFLVMWIRHLKSKYKLGDELLIEKAKGREMKAKLDEAEVEEKAVAEVESMSRKEKRNALRDIIKRGKSRGGGAVKGIVICLLALGLLANTASAITFQAYEEGGILLEKGDTLKVPTSGLFLSATDWEAIVIEDKVNANTIQLIRERATAAEERADRYARRGVLNTWEGRFILVVAILAGAAGGGYLGYSLAR